MAPKITNYENTMALSATLITIGIQLLAFSAQLWVATTVGHGSLLSFLSGIFWAWPWFGSVFLVFTGLYHSSRKINKIKPYLVFGAWIAAAACLILSFCVVVRYSSSNWVDSYPPRVILSQLFYLYFIPFLGFMLIVMGFCRYKKCLRLSLDM